MKSQLNTKAIRIHPLWTMNVCTKVLGSQTSRLVVEIFQSSPNSGQNDQTMPSLVAKTTEQVWQLNDRQKISSSVYLTHYSGWCWSGEKPWRSSDAPVPSMWRPAAPQCNCCFVAAPPDPPNSAPVTTENIACWHFFTTLSLEASFKALSLSQS